MISENIKEIRQEIEAACSRAGRSKEDITLIAVSKTKPVSMILEAHNEGIADFGENKVQELVDKYHELPKTIRWHMIGHLQRNKVKSIVDKVVMIHSVDSIRLAEQIDLEAGKINRVMDVLLEVNISGEESKYGFTADEALEAFEEIGRMPWICVKGLMTVAPFVENPEEVRIYFKKLHQLYIDMKCKNIDNVSMNALSMGMTGDYTVAIEEGATMIRVGSGIFGIRERK